MRLEVLTDESLRKTHVSQLAMACERDFGVESPWRGETQVGAH